MQTKRDLYEIKNALKKEISEALNELSMSAEIGIFEIHVNETYSVKGAFKVAPFLSQSFKRKGKFEATLGEKLKIVTLKITEDQQ